MVRYLLVLLGVLLISSTVMGLSTEQLTIEISLDQAGQAQVTERYTLKFAHGFERNEFLGDEEKYGGDLLLWSSDPDYNFFFPHFVQGNKYETTSSIAFIDQTNTLLLEYQTPDLVSVKEDSVRSTVWAIDNQAFEAFFDSTGSIKIPANTRIEINLPPASEVDTGTIPGGIEVYGNQIVLSGISTSFDALEYRVIKPIAPGVSAVDILTSPDMVGIVAVLLIVGAVLFFKRRDITSRIEEYIVTNSRIEIEEEEEESNLQI